MLSPLFDGPGFLFDESWELTTFHREAAALAATSEFWQDIEAEASGFELGPPTPAELDSLLDWSVEAEEAEHARDKLVHHDCMWAGKCDDKLHPGNSPCAPAPAPASPTVQSAPPGRSLLLVQRCRAGAAAPSAPAPPPPPRPDTPLSLDEEEAPPVFRHQVDVASTARRLLEDPRCSTVAADHSYTARPLAPAPPPPPSRDRFDNLGVQTPSDSEEEIDVETVGEKSYFQMSASSAPRAVALPTNPSAHDRHTLQRTVASAIGTRGRPPAGRAAQAPRKRLAAPPPELSPPRKRAKHSAGRRARPSPSPPHRRRIADSDSDGSDGNETNDVNDVNDANDGNDVEKRSLHNDMERMRRIGLKNLFDELKMQVPSTRDKARAPKVSILREAASLCRRLQAEDRELDLLRKQQQRLLARVRKLRLTMAPSYH